MSCQQATRLITTAVTITNSKAKIREDPYVFTDALSATPPILFNGQKSRAKGQGLLNTPTTTKAPAKVTRPANQKLPLTQINGFATKSAASVSSATTNFSNEQNIKIAETNASIHRAKQQRKQPQQLNLHQTSLPTPSLWQTPLLLETIVSPPTSPASLPSPDTPDSPAATASAPVKTSATLPPSNFHHTTFAQHLQKVGCIRKALPSHTQRERISNNPSNVPSQDVGRQRAICDVSAATPTTITSTAQSENSPPLLEPLYSRHQQHSDSDLNEIPVNVIYRKLPLTEGVSSIQLPAKPQNVDSKVVVTQKQVTTNLHEGGKTKTLKPASPLNKTTLQSSLACTTSKFIPKTAAPAKKAEKCLQTDVFAGSPKLTANKRKVSPPAILNPAPVFDLHPSKPCEPLENVKDEKCTAFAVVTCPAPAGINGWGTIGDTEEGPVYFRQHHWLGIYDGREFTARNGYGGGRGSFSILGRSATREEKIDQHRNLLRRQATQLLAMRKLMQYPLQTARRRLVCVDRLLRKHEDHREVDYLTKTCIVALCNNQALPMTTHCYAHIGHNVDQQLFLTCTAKFADNSQCRIPVFDIVHDLPLCAEHARKRDAYNRTWQEQHTARKVTIATGAVSMLRQENEFAQLLHQKPQQHQQKMPTKFVQSKAATATKPTLQRTNKRKPGSTAFGVIKPVGRPQKRYKKSTSAGTGMNASKPATAPPPLSAVKHRKSSSTSLESIASNSHSSHSQPSFVHAATANVVLAPPALAPLSGGGKRFQQQQPHQTLDYSAGFGSGIGVPSSASATISSFGGGVSRTLNFGNSSAGSQEVNQIVVQFAATPHDNNNSNSHTDFSSGLSLPSADEILTQDMLSICENSSVYASSEDTGVGGLSETELFAGAHDAGEIPLGDTRLLEEHDLANVLNTLPVDAFNELFTAVRQDERDEVERALEIADKHLKSLQQTIGSDSDFLGDFLNVSDHILDDSDICSKMGIVSSVLHSPETSGIDSGTLFEGIVGNVAGSSTAAGGNCSAPTDIRGLVQT